MSNATTNRPAKDSFQTTSYKGAWIQSCRNNVTQEDDVSWQFGGTRRKAASVTSAKRMITKHLNQKNIRPVVNVKSWMKQNTNLKRIKW